MIRTAQHALEQLWCFRWVWDHNLLLRIVFERSSPIRRQIITVYVYAWYGNFIFSRSEEFAQWPNWEVKLKARQYVCLLMIIKWWGFTGYALLSVAGSETLGGGGQGTWNTNCRIWRSSFSSFYEYCLQGGGSITPLSPGSRKRMIFERHWPIRMLLS